MVAQYFQYPWNWSRSTRNQDILEGISLQNYYIRDLEVSIFIIKGFIKHRHHKANVVCKRVALIDLYLGSGNIIKCTILRSLLNFAIFPFVEI